LKLEELRQRLREPDTDPDRPKAPRRQKRAAEEPPNGFHCRSAPADKSPIAAPVIATECSMCRKLFEIDPDADYTPSLCKRCKRPL
jgi:hypothetical protein